PYRRGRLGVSPRAASPRLTTSRGRLERELADEAVPGTAVLVRPLADLAVGIAAQNRTAVLLPRSIGVVVEVVRLTREPERVGATVVAAAHRAPIADPLPEARRIDLRRVVVVEANPVREPLVRAQHRIAAIVVDRDEARGFGAALRGLHPELVEGVVGSLGAIHLVSEAPVTDTEAHQGFRFRVVDGVDELVAAGAVGQVRVRVRARVARRLAEVVDELVLALAVDLHEVRADAEALAERLRLDEAPGGVDLVVLVLRYVAHLFRHEHARLVIPSVRPGTVRIREALELAGVRAVARIVDEAVVVPETL